MDCGFEASAESMDALMKTVSKHASDAHDMKQIPEDVKNKVTAAIHKH